MESKKKEVIRKVYGSNFQKYDVTEDGYSSEDNSEFYPDIEWHPSIPHLWRPYGLRGIENNNGWIAIESEENLPYTDGVECYIKIHNSDSIEIAVFDSRHGDGERFYTMNGDLWAKGVITHYQPIIKPENPLY